MEEKTVEAKVSAERRVELLQRRLDLSHRFWMQAAKAALADIPGASRSDHPAHDLWLRVQMAEVGPVEIVQSAALKATAP